MLTLSPGPPDPESLTPHSQPLKAILVLVVVFWYEFC